MFAMASWYDFEMSNPGLARFGADRFAVPPAYLATVRANGAPRVHPITPIIGAGHLFVFMEPTSPKGRDLTARRWYALHNGVPDINGRGGEFFVSGQAVRIEDPAVRADAIGSSSYVPADRYILFELGVDEARCNGYGDVVLPRPGYWRA